MYALHLKKSVIKDLKRIGRKNAARILGEIRKKLLRNPKAGKPLKGQDGVIWSFRVGDFRILYTFNEKELFLLVVRIGHRREVYKDM